MNDIDMLAKNHINSFWSRYGLSLKLEVEHKIENTARRAAFWGKAHYSLLTLSEKVIYKVRGFREFQSDGITKQAYMLFMDAIINGIDEIPNDLTYSISKMIKLKEWRMKRGETQISFPNTFKTSLPSNLRFFTLHMPFYTLKEYLSRKKETLPNRDSFHIVNNLKKIYEMVK